MDSEAQLRPCGVDPPPTPATFDEERRSGIGGSDAPVILGLSPRKTPLRLWAEKRGIVEEPDLDEVEYVRWGQRLEPIVAEVYAETTKRTVIPWPKHEVHPDHPFIVGHVDRLVEAEGKSGRGVLEAKTTGFFRTKDWDIEPPLAFQVQLQHYLAVTGAEWGSLAVLIGGQSFRWCDVPRNDRFIKKLVRLEIEFWARVESGDPPDPGPIDAKTLLALYPAETGDEAVALPPESLDWDGEIARLDGEIKERERRADELRNFIRASIGERAIGFLPGNTGRWSWKASTRTTATCKLHDPNVTTTRTLRRLSK